MGNAIRLILGAAFLLLTFIWVFPSWVYVLDSPHFAFKAKIGSSWLWDPPMPFGASLDWVKNFSYSLAVLLVAAALCLWARLGTRP